MRTYPLFKVHVPVKETIAHLECMFERGFINEGAEVAELSEALKIEIGTNSLVLTNSCTSALTIALVLSGAGPGTEVVTTPMTCVATNTPIANVGARLVWADVDPRSGMIDPASVAARITPRTVAVMAVAWAGSPPDLAALQSVCAVRGVKLILDAAHAFGAEYRDAPAHRSADFTCYSFQAIKHFTTGDGGALICRDTADHRRAGRLKWFGLDRDAAKDRDGNWRGQQWHVDVEEAGYKFNMNNVAAAIGLAQIPHIRNILDRHRSNARLYDELLAEAPGVRPATRPAGGLSSHWVYTVQIAQAAIARDETLQRLNAEGVMAGVVHVPNDDYTTFRHSKTELPNVRQFAASQFSLPCGWWLDEDDVRHIATRVLDIVR